MRSEDEKDSALRALLAEVARLRAREERLRVENEHLIEAQRALEENRDQYSDLFDYAPVAWLTVDDDGTIQNLNLQAVTLLGFGRRYLIGSPLTSLVRGEDRRQLMDQLFACQPGGEPTACELKLVARDRRELLIRLSIRVTRGRAEGYTVTLLDLSEREAGAAEHRRLTVAERDARVASEARDQFMTMLSHELRTPLTPALAAASALAEAHDLPLEVRAALGVVHRNVAAEARLIDDLLDLAQISQGKLRIDKGPLDAHRIVTEALEALAEKILGSGIALVSELTATDHWADGDATRLRQVFGNLAHNALKFTAPGGQIAVRSWNRDDKLLIEVSDTGQGIDAETLTRLFQSFEPARDYSAAGSTGLGLGLAIARGILEQHGATVVASSPGRGKGARFVVELATTAARGTMPAEPLPPAAPPNKPLRVLLVEDHEDTAAMFELLLRRAGYEVRVVNSLQAALAVERDAFDVLLSDVGLTDGSGLDLMRTLRKAGQVKGIALSGYGTEDDVRASKEAGFAQHITKPVNFGALMDAIAALGAG